MSQINLKNQYGYNDTKGYFYKTKINAIVYKPHKKLTFTILHPFLTNYSQTPSNIINKFEKSTNNSINEFNVNVI